MADDTVSGLEGAQADLVEVSTAPVAELPGIDPTASADEPAQTVAHPVADEPAAAEALAVAEAPAASEELATAGEPSADKIQAAGDLMVAELPVAVESLAAPTLPAADEAPTETSATAEALSAVDTAAVADALVTESPAAVESPAMAEATDSVIAATDGPPKTLASAETLSAVGPTPAAADALVTESPAAVESPAAAEATHSVIAATDGPGKTPASAESLSAVDPTPAAAEALATESSTAVEVHALAEATADVGATEAPPSVDEADVPMTPMTEKTLACPETIAAVYVDGGTGGTRLFLAHAAPDGSAVCLRQIGAILSPVAQLGDCAPTEGEDPEPAASVLSRRAEFIEGFRAVLAHATAGHTIREVVIGLTAWHRELRQEDSGAFESLFAELRRCVGDTLPTNSGGLHILPLSGRDEARYEQVAATFAAQKVLDIEQPDVVLSFGTGSIQCSCGPQYGSTHCSLPLRLKDGEAQIASGEPGFGSWESSCDAACMEGLAPCRAACSAMAGQERTGDSTIYHLIAVGACFHAAVAAGLVGGEHQGPKVCGLEEVLRLSREAAMDSTRGASDRANVVRLYSALEALFHGYLDGSDLPSRCRVVFARDWVVNGQTFRSTWSAGHFLEAVEAFVPKAQPADPTGDGEDVTSAGGGAEGLVPTTQAGGEKCEGDTACVVLAGEEEVATLLGDPESAEAVEPDALVEVGDKNLVMPAAHGDLPLADERVGDLAAQQLPITRVQPPPLGPAVDCMAGGPVPGLVIYVVAPAAGAAGEAALSCEEYRALSAAALRSGAAVVLSASAPSGVASVDFEVARASKVLRQVSAFADGRFRAPTVGVLRGCADTRALGDLFDALDTPDVCALDAGTVASGLRSLGFPGDAVGAAAALTVAASIPEGSKVTREEFCSALVRASEQPELVVVCPAAGWGGGGEYVWPVARPLLVEDDGVGEVGLATKTGEAQRLAGPAGGYGVVVVLTARARTLLTPGEYEQRLRAELGAAAVALPPHWPLLWCPGPAEVGLLTASATQRAIWAMPKAAGPHALTAWLRYLLVVRPGAPAGA